ncbi:MAG TPA: LemA family protein [Ktedonobacteraceae bacterium]|nr:LemA family protein [Chthonomonadales bacterium]HEV2582135.1 LemA family protein [Ktedonobacteraceae bacterium]
MFDNEKLPTYDDRTGYGERPGYARESPAYSGMTTAGMGEKAASPKPFWTRAKIISAAVIALLLLGGIVCIYQNITIQQRQYDIQGKVGAVWNEVDRASQLLQQDAALLNSTIASQNEAISKIAQARSNVASIKAGQGTSDPNAALAAANQLNAGIRVFVESYPDYGVGNNTHSVLVQIEGSFNRIEYARSQLISAQTDFNKWLLTQIPMNLFYHPVQILGSNSNPAGPVPVPTYAQPTP